MNQKTEAANTLRELSATLGHSHSVSSKARNPKTLSYNDPQLPQAQGLAIGDKIAGRNRVTICVVSDEEAVAISTMRR